jgi:transcriptional regulator with XRE-family HTH domain
MNYLRQARELRGMTKAEAARLVGVDRGEYCRIEARLDREDRGAGATRADRIAKAFGNTVTRDQILFPKDYVGLQKAS